MVVSILSFLPKSNEETNDVFKYLYGKLTQFSSARTLWNHFIVSQENMRKLRKI